MAYADDFHRTELLDRVCECARWRLGEEQAAAIAPYLHQYYARVPLDDIADKGPDTLFGAAFAHWRLGQQRQVGTPAVRVYNPRLDEHGWQCAHSVVEIVTDDMPFLVEFGDGRAQPPRSRRRPDHSSRPADPPRRPRSAGDAARARRAG